MNEEKEEKIAQEEDKAENAIELELSEVKDQLLRSFAENENLRKRFQKEREDLLKYGVTNLAKDFLSIADNLQRALSSANGGTQEKGLVEGVELIIKELNSIFAKHGITCHRPKGEKFDPNLHQAVFEVEHAEHEPGTVIEVLQDGYLIYDRLLRPAMVGVSKKPPA